MMNTLYDNADENLTGTVSYF